MWRLSLCPCIAFARGPSAWRVASWAACLEGVIMSDAGRNEDGTFAEGNTFSDGRNKYARQHELKQLFAEAVTHQEIQRLANKLTALALDGDMTAAKLLLTTLFKDPPSPAIALQVNNGNSLDANKSRMIAIANRIKLARLKQEAGIEETQSRVIEVSAKRKKE